MSSAPYPATIRSGYSLRSVYYAFSIISRWFAWYSAVQEVSIDDAFLNSLSVVTVWPAGSSGFRRMRRHDRFDDGTPPGASPRLDYVGVYGAEVRRTTVNVEDEIGVIASARIVRQELLSFLRGVDSGSPARAAISPVKYGQRHSKMTEGARPMTNRFRGSGDRYAGQPDTTTGGRAADATADHIEQLGMLIEQQGGDFQFVGDGLVNLRRLECIWLFGACRAHWISGCFSCFAVMPTSDDNRNTLLSTLQIPELGPIQQLENLRTGTI